MSWSLPCRPQRSGLTHSGKPRPAARLLWAQSFWALLLLVPLGPMPSGATPAPASSSPSVATMPPDFAIPYTLLPYHLQPFVQVRLNGTLNATFVVDTGSNFVGISQSLVQKLGLTPSPGFQTDGKPLLFQGKQVMDVPVQSLTFPDATTTGAMPLINGIDNVFPDQLLIMPPALAHPHEPAVPFDGILGTNLLSGFAVEFDPSRHCLTLCYPGSLSASQLAVLGFGGPGVASLPLTDPDNTVRYYVPIDLTNGTTSQTVSLAVDTGSDVTIIPRAAAQALHLKATGKEPYYMLMGSTTVDKATVPGLKLGGITVPQAAVVYPEKGTYYPVLGMDILSHFRVLLDFPAGKMYLAPDAPTPTATPAKPDVAPPVGSVSK